jgi:hypothetical protein
MYSELQTVQWSIFVASVWVSHGKMSVTLVLAAGLFGDAEGVQAY